MTDFSHLNAIQERLFRAEQRLLTASAKDRPWYEHEVAMIVKEETAEYAFLGVERPTAVSLDDILDDDLLAELGL